VICPFRLFFKSQRLFIVRASAWTHFEVHFVGNFIKNKKIQQQLSLAVNQRVIRIEFLFIRPKTSMVIRALESDKNSVYKFLVSIFKGKCTLKVLKFLTITH
jgi:hypothetical protein